MLKKIFTRLSNILLTVLILAYLILEELIWDKIAEPIYRFLHSLKILQRLEGVIHGLNRYALLAIFLFLFVSVELIGIFAIALFAEGQVLIATIIYTGKIPIAAFTFWLFKVAKDKLLTFDWFNYCFNGLLAILGKIKTSTVYVKVKARIHAVKAWITSLGLGNLLNRLKLALGFKV